MRVRWKKQAREELREAIAYFESKRSGLGEELAGSVIDSLDQVTSNPKLFARYEATKTQHEYRRVHLKRFRYLIIYQVREDDEVLVVAMAHTSRRPGYWEDR